MDPVITTAIFAALANLSKDAIKDSYEALKALLKKEFGEKSDVVDAIEKLEKDPERKDRQATVETELGIAKASNDSEILKLAQQLLDKIKEEPGGNESIRQIQNITVSGNTTTGNFTVSPSQEA